MYLVSQAGTDLRKASMSCIPGDVIGISRLRRRWNAQQVSCALELHEARKRAVGKLENPHEIIADRIGVEQATDSIIAGYKSKRIHESGLSSITDLCCGIGGDTIALARCMETIGIDLDPVKAWMTGMNARCTTHSQDVMDANISTDAIHIDPARRDMDTGRRTHAPARWSPDEQSLIALLSSHPNAAVKMGPGIKLDSIRFQPSESEIEFISLDGHLKQAMLWTGRLAGDAWRATRCGADGHHTLSSSTPVTPPVRSPRWEKTWLHVPDPAIERSGLLGLVCKDHDLAEPANGLGILFGDHPARSPWLTPYRVVEHMPWRLDRIRDWLRAHDAGQVEIRTRGKAVVDVDQLRNQLKGSGDQAWTLFGLRLGHSRIAVMTHPRNDDGAP